MLNAGDIRNVKFSKSMGGYKQEEVDVLLDKIEADYVDFERTIKDFQGKITTLNKDIETYKVSQNSIQNVLLSAQKLADQIIDDAKQKSSDIIKNAESSIAVITAQEKELSTAFEIKATERKSKLDKEIEEKIKLAKAKTESIDVAANDSVARQQVLFDKLKMEVAAFKTEVTKSYKQHLEVLQRIPDSVPMDPEHIAGLVSEEYDKEPDVKTFIKSKEVVEEKPKQDEGFVVSDNVSTEQK